MTKSTTYMSSLSAAVLLTALLTGCTSGGVPEPEPTTAEPAVEYATENQVASVIAKYESDWREVIEGAGECRLGWTTASSDDVQASLEGFTCYTREKTMGATTQLAVDELDALDIPPSMDALVSSTSTTLKVLAGAELESSCGEDGSPDTSSDACTSTLGMLNTGYAVLEQDLDAWRPYF